MVTVHVTLPKVKGWVATSKPQEITRSQGTNLDGPRKSPTSAFWQWTSSSTKCLRFFTGLKNCSKGRWFGKGDSGLKYGHFWYLWLDFWGVPLLGTTPRMEPESTGEPWKEKNIWTKASFLRSMSILLPFLAHALPTSPCKIWSFFVVFSPSYLWKYSNHEKVHITIPTKNWFSEQSCGKSESDLLNHLFWNPICQSFKWATAFINHILKGRMCFSYSLPRSINF